ncbi:hypothetical protein KAR91_65960 [Candidatus Pacearchaeota archaeon]|nr:hypothetical protein [Candidatus Pacearchaeota archaeon]
MTDFFDRFWELQIKAQDGSFDFIITQDEFNNSLHIEFEVNATLNLLYYTGTIKIINLLESKWKQLIFNQLGDDFGSGPLVRLTAGYKSKNGLIFDGAALRGYTVVRPETAETITILEVGLPIDFVQEVTIEPANSTVIGALNGLYNYLVQSIQQLLSGTGRLPIKTVKGWENNLKDAIDDFLLQGAVKNKALGYSGNWIQILKEMSEEFNIIFLYDNKGFNVAGRRFEGSTNIAQPITIPNNTTLPEIVLISGVDGDPGNGLLGSPTYTDTGAKLICYLRPDLRIMQLIGVRSRSLDKNISITELIHRGNSHTNEWYSEIDGSNINQLVKRA